ncbi:MAG TPA: hypothetical protein VJ385_14980 [Fibrobacteria bacterium]|nr:hypothetical protein [Fibrobacteria bacterium]
MKLALGIVVYSIVGILVILFLGYTAVYHAWRSLLPNADVEHAHNLGMIFYWLTAGSLVMYIVGLVVLVRKAGKKLDRGFSK